MLAIGEWRQLVLVVLTLTYGGVLAVLAFPALFLFYPSCGSSLFTYPGFALVGRTRDSLGNPHRVEHP